VWKGRLVWRARGRGAVLPQRSFSSEAGPPRAIIDSVTLTNSQLTRTRNDRVQFSGSACSSASM